MQENSGLPQALSPHHLPWHPALGPMLAALCTEDTPLEELEVLLLSTVGQGGSSQHSLLVLSTEGGHWPACFRDPLPGSAAVQQAGQLTFPVLCVPETGPGPGTAPSGRSAVL